MVRSRVVRLAVAVAACQLLSTTSAQFLTVPGTASASRTGSVPAASSPVQHLMKVGSGGFKFTPEQLFNVSAGDTVTFEFYGPDHSVVQAEYGNPCVPYSYVDSDHAGKGFWTELQFLDPGQNSYFNITINDTAPIFFYCAAPNSCIEKYMVGAINANSTQTLASQIQAAQKADFQIAVGDPIPNEATSTILNAPTSTPSPAHPPSSGAHLSGGAIAGIVVGGVAFLVICAALFFYVGRSKSLKEVLKRQDGNGNRSSTPGPDMGFMPHDQVPRYGSPAPAYAQHNVGEQYPSGW